MENVKIFVKLPSSRFSAVGLCRAELTPPLKEGIGASSSCVLSKPKPSSFKTSLCHPLVLRYILMVQRYTLIFYSFVIGSEEMAFPISIYFI